MFTTHLQMLYSIFIWDVNKHPLPSNVFSALAVHESSKNTIVEFIFSNLLTLDEILAALSIWVMLFPKRDAPLCFAN